MASNVTYTKNNTAAVGVEIFPSGKVALNVSVKSLLDADKIEHACAILTREELIEIRDDINAVLDA